MSQAAAFAGMQYRHTIIVNALDLQGRVASFFTPYRPDIPSSARQRSLKSQLGY